MIVNMEAATRHNGYFWIYQHDEGIGEEEEYSWAYELFNEYVFFNRSEPDPVPLIPLFPGVEGRPYRGPDGCSLLLLPDNLGRKISDNVTLVTSRTDLLYVGENLSVLELGTKTIDLEQLPCLIYGLTEKDIAATEAYNLLLKLEVIVGYCDGIGIIGTSSYREALDLGLSRYREGEYDEAIGGLRQVLGEAYPDILDQLMPRVEAGISSPRDSPIPLTPLIRISVANRMFDEGDDREAETYLLAGLKGWFVAIPEPVNGFVAMIGLVAMAIGPKSRWNRR
jgi:hypothetical protein